MIQRILVVEDEPLTAFDNEQRLEQLGYEVVGTRDTYEDARRDIEFEQIDLVLADIQLSGTKSGIDVAEAAKARGIPVLFATGNPPSECAIYAVGALVKPYTDKQLKEAIQVVEKVLEGDRVDAPKGLKLYA
nr:response regulator [Sphingomicrobium sediminis]